MPSASVSVGVSVGAGVGAGRGSELPVARGQLALLLGALAWAAGTAHAQASAAHLGEWPLAALFFGALAAGQFGVGALLWARPSRRLLAVAAAGSLAVAGLWVLSRTAGLPFGPEVSRREAAGVPDIVATLDELLLAGASLAVLGRWAKVSLSPVLLHLVLIASLASAMLAGGHSH
jgi:hypothetical protein